MNNNYKDYAVIYYLYETILISTLPKDVANKLTFSLLTLKKKNLFKLEIVKFNYKQNLTISKKDSLKLREE